MSRFFNICNIYILLWCIFDYTFALSMPISRPLFVIIFAITVYYTISVYRHPPIPIYLKGLTLLLFTFTIYGIVLLFSDIQLYIHAIDKPVSKTVYLITIYKSLLPIFPFYAFTKKGLLTDRTIVKWLPIFLVITTATFFSTNQMMIEMSETGRLEFTNNTGFIFVSLLPFVFFLDKKNTFQYITLFFIFSFIVLSMKRGALLCGIIFIVWFIVNGLKDAGFKKRIMVIVSIIIFIGAGYYLINHLFNTSEYFRIRIEDTIEGESSGRDMLYQYITYYFKNRMTAWQQVFGLGAESTLLINDNYAHNDWLEILINNGIFGIIVYLIYWRCCIKELHNIPKHSTIRKMWVGLFLIYFTKTFFSMSYGGMTCFAALCIGYCLANIPLYNRTTTNSRI